MAFVDARVLVVMCSGGVGAAGDGGVFSPRLAFTWSRPLGCACPRPLPWLLVRCGSFMLVVVFWLIFAP